MTDLLTAPQEEYSAILLAYLKTPGEGPLYHASLLSRSFLEAGVGPDEITAIHCDAVGEVVSNKEANAPRTSAGHGLGAVSSCSSLWLLTARSTRSTWTYASTRACATPRPSSRASERSAAERVLRRSGTNSRSSHLSRMSSARRSPRHEATCRGRATRIGGPACGPARPCLAPSSSAIDRLTKLTGNLIAASQGMAFLSSSWRASTCGRSSTRRTSGRTRSRTKRWWWSIRVTCSLPSTCRRRRACHAHRVRQHAGERRALHAESRVDYVRTSKTVMATSRFEDHGQRHRHDAGHHRPHFREVLPQCGRHVTWSPTASASVSTSRGSCRGPRRPYRGREPSGRRHNLPPHPAYRQLKPIERRFCWEPADPLSH